MDSDALDTFLTVHRRGGISNAAKAVSTEIPAGVTSYAPSNVVASAAANLIINKTASPTTPNNELCAAPSPTGTSCRPTNSTNF